MVTESKKGQAKDVDVEQEVITERDTIKEIIVDFPPELSSFRSIKTGNIKYINKNFNSSDPSGSQEKLSQP